MRVAMLTYYPEDAQRIPGGIRMVSFNLVQALRGYPDLELYVLHCHSDIAGDRVVQEGGVTIRYLAMPRRRIIPNLVTSIGRVRGALRSIRPDVVHAHAGHLAYASLRAGYPTVFTLHGVLSRERRVYSSSWFDRWRYGLLYAYERYAVAHAQAPVAISPFVLAEYAPLRTSGWCRIDNPVPRSFFDLPNGAEPGRVLYAGSITKIKDLLTLLRAIEHVRSTYPAVRLRIAGRSTDDRYAQQVYRYVEEHALQDVVVFLGLLDRERILEEYRLCTVVALSSVQENAPMAVIEAMAAGKPVVATRVGGVPDLVTEGQTGYLVSAGDARRLGDRLCQVLADTPLARRLGEQARQVALQRFGAEQIARKYHDLYVDLGNRAGRDRVVTMRGE